MEKGNNFQLVLGINYPYNFNILGFDKIKEMKLFYDYTGTYDANEKKSRINNKICDST